MSEVRAALLMLLVIWVLAQCTVQIIDTVHEYAIAEMQKQHDLDMRLKQRTDWRAENLSDEVKCKATILQWTEACK